MNLSEMSVRVTLSPCLFFFSDPLISPSNRLVQQNCSPRQTETPQTRKLLTTMTTNPPTAPRLPHAALAGVSPPAPLSINAISLRASSSCSGRTCVQKRPQEEEPPPNDAFDRSDPRHPHPSPCPSIRKGAPFGAQTRGGEKRPVWVWVNAAANLIGGILDRSMYI